MKRNVLLNWVLILTFVMVTLAGMTVTVSAADEPVIQEYAVLYIGETRLINNGDSVAGTNGGTATLSGTLENPILTLDGFNYSGYGYKFDELTYEGYHTGRSAIYYNGETDLTVILKGKNFVCSARGNTEIVYGIYSYLGSFCFQQSEGCKGSLDVTGSGWRDSYGIEGNIIVNSGSLSVKAESEEDKCDATAIRGSVTINNGSLFCEGGKCGIDGTVVTIESSGSLTAIGGSESISENVTNKIAGKGWRSLPAEGEGEDIPVNTSQNGKCDEYKKVVFGTENDNTHKHGDIIFTRWTDKLAAEQYGNSNMEATNCLPGKAGHYYLTEDVDLGSSSWDVPSGKTDLCLNGHNIKSDHDDYAVNIEKQGSTLDLYDDHTGDSAGMIKGTEGDGVYLGDYTVFNMYGGKISDCDDNGVNLDESGARFNMYGGEISNCYYGVDANESDTVFTLHSGTITGNKKAGVRVYGTFVIENGLITNNKTGVETSVTSEGIILQGSSIAPVITGNTEHDLVLDRSSDRKIIVSDGTTISGNAQIGIYPTNGSSVAAGVFTDGLPDKIQGNKTAADIFTSDRKDYSVSTTADGEAELIKKDVDPIGSIDLIEGKEGSINVSGWAYDPSDLTKPVEIQVYIGGEAGAEGVEGHSGIKANEERTDVDDVYHCGDHHGFSATITTDKLGEQNVYVYAINIGEGKNVCLGNKTVKITKKETPVDPDKWEGHEPYDLTEPEEYPYGQPEPTNNWHEPVMKPGDTYDCSDAGWNTTVYIKEPGEYTLKGKSENVRVVINSGDVKLYLADGLNLNCSSTTYVGSRTSAINVDVEEQTGGTVTLISKRYAVSYFEGYMAPGIRKDGCMTKLVFETEDPEKPGIIKAKGGKLSPGIGGVPYASVTHSTTGNMEFNSGKIYATGADYAAGIGGGNNGGADIITINGGTVTAYGGTKAAGIGGGDGGALNRLTIKGGIVNAIGYSDYAPGIGAGKEGTANEISIEGGIVYAAGGAEAPGIGVYGTSDGQVLRLKINGGAVTAKRGENGSYDIGMNDSVPSGNTKVTITGGSLYADKVQNAKDANQNALHRLDVTFYNTADGLEVKDVLFSDSSYQYAFEGVTTDSGGKVYLWVPDLKLLLLELTVGGKRYEGMINLFEKEGLMRLSRRQGTDEKYNTTFKVSKKTVKKGKKTTVKVTSNSGAKIKVVGANKKTKKIIKKKLVKIKNGKTAKILFTKKVPKGKYTFTVTAPAKGKYKKAAKKITISVK